MASGNAENCQQWLNADIDLDELSGESAYMARVIGIDRFLALCEIFGGTNVYVPKKERILQKIRDGEIKREFGGQNYKRIAAKYGLSERRIRQIVNGSPDRKKQNSSS